MKRRLRNVSGRQMWTQMKRERKSAGGGRSKAAPPLQSSFRGWRKIVRSVQYDPTEDSLSLSVDLTRNVL